MWHFEYQWTLIETQREAEALIRPIFGGVVSHFCSASSVGDIWAMRDDGPPCGRQTSNVSILSLAAVQG